MYRISQLFIYPVKSLGGIELSSVELTDRGFHYDRRWMLVDESNRFLTQREYPAMSLLKTVIQNDQLVIYPINNMDDKHVLSLSPPIKATIKVTVWDDECNAQFISEASDQWFSDKLSVQCRLVYMPDSAKRKVDEHYALKSEITSLSDAFPLMIVGQASLDDLNSRLALPVPMNRFRPNIVFTGGHPFDEDMMEHIRISNIDLYGVKLCARCVITTIDQLSALKSKEPLKTLAGYRLVHNKVMFGQNLLYDKLGRINVGDKIEMISHKPSLKMNGQDH